MYGGPSAEPALGPVTYIHRTSASELPLAPLGHHLQDSTHISFGVITTGLIFDHVKLEGSMFNGREPNEERWGIQLNPLDSWSVRGSIAPTRNWTAEYSYGLLVHPEALEPSNERRQTASIAYNRPLCHRSLRWNRSRLCFKPFPTRGAVLWAMCRTDALVSLYRHDEPKSWWNPLFTLVGRMYGRERRQIENVDPTTSRLYITDFSEAGILPFGYYGWFCVLLLRHL